MYQDETLTCRDCGKEFVFTASEQAFYAEKGFQNKPRRCPECRAAVPFQPRGDKPVYCRDCFANHRQPRY